jgi:hypothetical protein
MDATECVAVMSSAGMPVSDPPHSGASVMGGGPAGRIPGGRGTPSHARRWRLPLTATSGVACARSRAGRTATAAGPHDRNARGRKGRPDSSAPRIRVEPARTFRPVRTSRKKQRRFRGPTSRTSAPSARGRGGGRVRALTDLQLASDVPLLDLAAPRAAFGAAALDQLLEPLQVAADAAGVERERRTGLLDRPFRLVAHRETDARP